MTEPIQIFEDQEIIQGFIDEGREMLDDIEPSLIELELDSVQHGELNSEVINKIFRLFHSMKGSAGFLNLITLGELTHTAETLLNLFRNDIKLINRDHIDLLNRTCDFIRVILNQVATKQHDKGCETEAGVIIDDLKLAIGAIEIKNTNLPADQVFTNQSLIKPMYNKAISAAHHTPDVTQHFVSESQDLLETGEDALLAFENEPENEELVATALQAFHTFKCNSIFMGFKDLERISQQIEDVLKAIIGGDSRGGMDNVSMILDAVEFLYDGVEQVANGEHPQIVGSDTIIDMMKRSIAVNAKERHKDRNSNRIVSEPFRKPVNQTSISPRSSDISSEEEIPDNSSTVKCEPAIRVKYKRVDRRSNRRRRAEDNQISELATIQRQSLRVEIGKLDRLLDVVGELTIAQATVVQKHEMKVKDNGLGDYQKSVRQLNKITQEIQDISTSMRMIPLSGTFRRMIRLVRDLANIAGKKVELTVIGEDAEVDKIVIEQIHDPIVHAIRNAIDHGIETPDERIAAGKPETGKLILEARYVAGEVWIIVSDDGRGLNRSKIIVKAVEEGCLTGNSDELIDRDVWQLIFNPGFSTAKKVSELSGRGVGMDIVKRNVERIRGRVEIWSQEGEGTRLTMRMPLTMATIDGMIVRVENALYTIPIVSIKEVFQADRDQIADIIDGQEFVQFREKLVPAVRLHSFFGCAVEKKNLSDGSLIVIESDSRSLCLFVDEVIAQRQVVIKAIPAYIGNLKGISNCTILEDGNVCPIIDVSAFSNQSMSKDRKRSVA